jgi:hypothetical protein
MTLSMGIGSSKQSGGILFGLVPVVSEEVVDGVNEWGIQAVVARAFGGRLGSAPLVGQASRLSMNDGQDARPTVPNIRNRSLGMKLGT